MTKKIKTVLITGVSGFIGCHLAERLLNNQYVLIGVVKDIKNIDRISHLIDKIRLIESSKLSLSDMEDVDCVIHLATYYKKDHIYEDIDEMISTNITFPTKLLEYMNQKGIKYFINTGTFSEYEPSNNLLKETSLKNPYNLYSSTKISFEEMLKYYSSHYDIKAVSLKLFSPYGEKDNQKLIVSLIKHIFTNKVFEISKGEQRLDWTYISDIIDAYCASIDYIIKMNNNYEDFNIGTGKTVSILKIVELLEKYSSKRNLIRCIKPYRKDEIMHACSDNLKAKRLLKININTDIEIGLKKTYNYYINMVR